MPLGLQKASEPKATGSNGGSNSRSKEKEIFSQTTLLPKIKRESGFYIDRGRISTRGVSLDPPQFTSVGSGNRAYLAATETQSGQVPASTSGGNRLGSQQHCTDECRCAPSSAAISRAFEGAVLSSHYQQQLSSAGEH
ncbi:hypothetical protein ACLKA6_003343 [Drosophila palustris]